MPIHALPPELLGNILEYLHDEPGTSFQALSRVSKAFSVPAQRCLFRTLFLYGPFDDSLALLRGAPRHIRDAVRHFGLFGDPIELESDAERIEITQGLVAAFLALFPGLTRLTLCDADIKCSPADEDDLARIGEQGGKSLPYLELRRTQGFHDAPEEYVSLLSLFHTIGTLNINNSSHRTETIPTTSTFRTLDYRPVRSLGVQCAELPNFACLSWFDLLSNTRSVLESVDGQEGPTLRKIELRFPSVPRINALGELLRLGGKNIRHVTLSLDGFVDGRMRSFAEYASSQLSLGTSCPRLKTLTLVIKIRPWQPELRSTDVLVRSLRSSVDKLTLVFEIYHGLDTIDVAQELPHLWDGLATWLRGGHTRKAHVVFKVWPMSSDAHLRRAAGPAIQVVEDQLAAGPVATDARNGNVTVEWSAYLLPIRGSTVLQ